MKQLMIGALTVALLSGCANTADYYKSLDATNARQAEVARANADADAARYAALSRIAETGDSTSKVAAAMALALAGSSSSRQTPMAIPAAPQNEALQWASILVPSVTQLGFAWFNKQVQINASNNSRSVAESQISKDVQLGMGAQATYLGFAKEINDPTVVTSTSQSVVVVKPEVVNPVVVQPSVVNPVVVQPVVVSTP